LKQTADKYQALSEDSVVGCEIEFSDRAWNTLSKSGKKTWPVCGILCQLAC